MAKPYSKKWLLKKAVELRFDHRGDFDELCIEQRRCGVHFEMMHDEILWIGLYPHGNKGDCVHVWISAKGKLSVEVMEA